VPLRSKRKIEEGISSRDAKGRKERKCLQVTKKQEDKLSLLGYRYRHQVHLELSLKIKRDKISPLN